MALSEIISIQDICRKDPSNCMSMVSRRDVNILLYIKDMGLKYFIMQYMTVIELGVNSAQGENFG